MSLDTTPGAHARFLEGWHQVYPETPPISYMFKDKLRTRRARIHSLPEAVRYPTTKADWDSLLDRQNTVIDSLIAQGTIIQFVIN
jgi:hypothetical protein